MNSYEASAPGSERHSKGGGGGGGLSYFGGTGGMAGHTAENVKELPKRLADLRSPPWRFEGYEGTRMFIRLGRGASLWPRFGSISRSVHGRRFKIKLVNAFL